MYYGRKKVIIIAIVVVVLLVLLIIGGLFAFLFTDLFKSNETLFSKYAGQAIESMNYSNIELQNSLKAKQEKPYVLNGELSFNVEGNRNQDLNKLNNISATINANVNNLEEKTYAKVSLMNQNENIFNLEYANTDNIYAVKSDEIVTAFVGVRNDNLKVLAQKLGMTDTSNIPNIIQISNALDLLSLSDEEKQHIINTYLPVIMENIPKGNYSKQSNIPVSKDGIEYNTTSYRLDLSSEELANIVVKVLEEIKQDSITLNLIATKSKMLNLSEDYTQVNNLSKTIDKIINDINNSEKLPQDGLSITIYAEAGNTVLTEVIIKNYAKITLYGNKQNQYNLYMKIENLSVEDNYGTIEIQINENNIDDISNLQISINKDDEIKLEVTLSNSSSMSTEKIETNLNIVYTNNENILTISYKGDSTFVEEDEQQIVKLDNTNCAILNDYPTDQLQYIIQLITNQVINVYNVKAQILGFQPIVQTQQVENINENEVHEENI